MAPSSRRLPTSFRRIGGLTREVFGPVLHVVRFAGDRLADVCAAINATGYGLTLGLHTRIESDRRPRSASACGWATCM